MQNDKNTVTEPASAPSATATPAPSAASNSTGSGPVSTETENIPLGILGAVLGSLVGMLAIVLFDRLGYVASISGVIMAACTLLLYEKFAKKMSKTGIIVSIVIMIVMTLLAENVAFSIQAIEELNELGYSADFSDIFFNFYTYLYEGVFDMGTYIGGLVMVYAFTALGAAGTIIGKYKTTASKNKS